MILPYLLRYRNNDFPFEYELVIRRKLSDELYINLISIVREKLVERLLF